MSEDRPQYQAERDTVPTNAEIAERLRQMSSDMLVLWSDIERIRAYDRLEKVSRSMYLSTVKMTEWAHQIEEAQG